MVSSMLAFAPLFLGAFTITVYAAENNYGYTTTKTVTYSQPYTTTKTVTQPYTYTTTKTYTQSSSTSSFNAQATYCTPGKRFQQINETITFDDITVIPGNPFNPLPTPYALFDFQSFTAIDFIDLGVSGQPGVVPHSPPISIVTDPESQVEMGEPLMSVIYQNSNATAFDLKSFYYACAANEPEAAADAVATCNVHVTGYRGSTNTIEGAVQVCSHTFSFLPPTDIASAQQAFSGEITDCRGVEFVTYDYFGIEDFSGLTTEVAFSLDNIEVIVYTCE